MEYKADFDIETFGWHDGAKITIQTVREAGKLPQLERIIEDIFSNDEKIPTKGEINDFVWFESSRIYEQLGIPF